MNCQSVFVAGGYRFACLVIDIRRDVTIIANNSEAKKSLAGLLVN